MKFIERILIMTAVISTGFTYDYVCNNSQYNCNTNNTNTQNNSNNNANYASDNNNNQNYCSSNSNTRGYRR